MSPEKRDRIALAVAPLVFAFSGQPLTQKGIDSLLSDGLRFLTKEETKQLRLIAVEAAKVLER